MTDPDAEYDCFLVYFLRESSGSRYRERPFRRWLKTITSMRVKYRVTDTVRDEMSVGLVKYASAQQECFDRSTSAEVRKERGHFGTPAVIAEYMASQFSDFPPGPLRILDPGAGVGTLSASICQRVIEQGKPRDIFVELWENDPALTGSLKETMSKCRSELRAAGHQMEFAIRTEDFILANTQKSLFDQGPAASFHCTIINPPYFKLRKDSAQARVMNHIVHGQPNIYAFFMAVAADKLLPGGQMVTITPRSYFNGPYFKRFRKWFFDRMTARQIHIFESRAEAFRDDSVLQENVILRAEKAATSAPVLLTTSNGRDLKNVKQMWVSYDKIIDNSDGDHLVRITTDQTEQEILESMGHLANRFRDLGFEISTGPVVTFRATAFLRNERSADTAPLLWMHNVRPFVTQFPQKNGKPHHIAVTKASEKLLVPSKTYVLLKRFSAKEEKRRLVAGIVNPSDSYSQWIGLENHLNYVYRIEGTELSLTEAFGLAAFFNSAFVDRYFRGISGSTQVNAAEIRTMPVPDEKTLAKIGQSILQSDNKSYELVERIVGRELGLRKQLTDELIKANQ